MNNTWPGGCRHVMGQAEHERWNARNYPGTKQLCTTCNQPTERCEEDTLYADNDEDNEHPLCEECRGLGEVIDAAIAQQKEPK